MTSSLCSSFRGKSPGRSATVLVLFFGIEFNISYRWAFVDVPNGGRVSYENNSTIFCRNRVSPEYTGNN